MNLLNILISAVIYASMLMPNYSYSETINDNFALRYTSDTDKNDMQTLKPIHLYSLNTPIDQIINDPIFSNYGRLIFPLNKYFMSGNTVKDLKLAWYSNIDPNKTLEIVNYLKTEIAGGRQIFFDIYSDEEKAADPSKKDTCLFFFKGKEGYPFAVCNAGGGFSYVGAIHDSFPHALELSKKGYNAFALIYRPDAQSAIEDLARAVTFIFNNADKFKISTSCYSVWGGSAGARMAAWLGSYGPYAFGGADLPRPGAVIMQYTGHNEYTREDPPTFACVGENDGIADWRIMQLRINALKKLNIDTEFHHYKGLRHGFGLGTHTIAENWLNEAVNFWEKQQRKNLKQIKN